MKIVDLKIEGFRSFKSAVWSPGDLNVLIGPNASGKSNLLSLLEMISLSARGKLSKYVKNQGGMEPLVWDGKAESIEICLVAACKDKESLTYKFAMDRVGKGSKYQIDNEVLEVKEHSLLRRNAQKGEIYVNGRDLYIEIEKHLINEQESLLSVAGSPFVDNQQSVDYQRELASWSIYSHLDTGPDASIRRPAVTSFEKQVEPDGQNFIAVLHTLYEEDRDFKEEINTAMRSAFGADFEELSFPPASDGRTQLRVRWKSLKTPQSTANLSDGTLRFLFLLTVLANPKAGALIAIDEPETGLHPGMFGIIADFAVEASSRSQVIITTHSPEFLSAFGQRRPTTTVAQWCKGQTILRVLPEEKLDYWLKEYSLGELYRSGELEDIG